MFLGSGESWQLSYFAFSEFNWIPIKSLVNPSPNTIYYEKPVNYLISNSVEYYFTSFSLKN